MDPTEVATKAEVAAADSDLEDTKGLAMMAVKSRNMMAMTGERDIRDMKTSEKLTSLLLILS